MSDLVIDPGMDRGNDPCVDHGIDVLLLVSDTFPKRDKRLLDAVTESRIKDVRPLDVERRGLSDAAEIGVGRTVAVLACAEVNGSADRSSSGLLILSIAIKGS